MNRGTATKWVAALERTDARYDSAQLGFMVEHRRYLSPSGVLADFLDPDGWEVGWDGVSLLWHGEQFRLPAVARARCKMKTDGYEPFQCGDEAFRSLADAEAMFDNHADFADFVRRAHPAI